jgi:NAD(P)-dependent dehydrogenase (short-subunit alcohol dehydrogenase family)
MVEAAVERYGRLDVLMNNVAVIKTGTVVDVDEDDWDTAMDVNLKGMMLASRHAIPAMIETGGGSIVNISSIEAVRPGSFAALTPYSVSKGGVVTLTLTMAVQHGRDNIRANCILPGYIYTPMVAPHLSEEGRSQRAMVAPLGTEGTAWDIAQAALFLSSDDARWVTGVLLPVDAGLLAASPLSVVPYLAG